MDQGLERLPQMTWVAGPDLDRVIPKTSKNDIYISLLGARYGKSSREKEPASFLLSLRSMH